jgi:hypothetical protein
MNAYWQKPSAQWIIGGLLSLMAGGWMWYGEIYPVIQDINLLSQNNHHISQKLKSVRQDNDEGLWSAPQLYRWISLNQQRFGVELISVKAEREGLELIIQGSPNQLEEILTHLSRSGVQSMWWQANSEQIEFILNAVTVQEDQSVQNQWIGEAGSPQQHYCVYQNGHTIKLRKKDKQC